MADINLIGRLVQGYTLTQKLGAGGYGKVYLGIKEDSSGQYQTAVKHISIPDAEVYDAVMQDYSYNKEATQAHFEKMVAGITSEIKALLKLSKKDNRYIVAYYDHDIQKSFEPLHYDILIRMEYLTPLNKAIRQKGMTIRDVISLGFNISDALILCHKSGIMHRDIKEANIFVTEDNTYKLGDFGVAKSTLETTQAMTMKGTPSYIAPEIYLHEPYGKTVDIYSLGIVLYRLLNNQRNPFMPDAPASFTVDEKNYAEGRRIKGDIPPAPYYAKNRLGEIIIKACSVKEQRYSTEEEFKNDLQDYYNALTDDDLNSVIIQPIDEDDEPLHPIPINGKDNNNSITYNHTGGVTMTMGAIDNHHIQTPIVQQPSLSPDQKNPYRKTNNIILTKFNVIAAIIAGVFVVGAIIVVMIVLSNTKEPQFAHEPPNDQLMSSPSPEVTSKPHTDPTPEPTTETTSEAINDEINVISELSNEALLNAVMTVNDFIRVHIHWEDNTTTIFERDLNSPLWKMDGRSGVERLVDPVFSLRNDILVIEFPTTNSAYYLYNGESSYFGSPGANDNENINWSFETSNTFSTRTMFGANETYGLTNVIFQNQMVTIYINWLDGRTTIFYLNRGGQWNMRSRNEISLTSVSPTFSDEYEYVLMTFASGSHPYMLFTDGTGWRDDEFFYWSFSYSSH